MGMASPGCFGPGWGRLHLCPACWWHRLPSRGSARIKVKIPDCVCAQLAVGIGHLTTVGGPFVTALVISDGLGGFSLIWTLPVLLLGALSDRHSSIWWYGCSCDHRAGGSSPPPPGKVKEIGSSLSLVGRRSYEQIACRAVYLTCSCSCPREPGPWCSSPSLLHHAVVWEARLATANITNVGHCSGMVQDWASGMLHMLYSHGLPL